MAYPRCVSSLAMSRKYPRDILSQGVSTEGQVLGSSARSCPMPPMTSATSPRVFEHSLSSVWQDARNYDVDIRGTGVSELRRSGRRSYPSVPGTVRWYVPRRTSARWTRAR